MELVRRHAPSIPIPEVKWARYKRDNNGDVVAGELAMTRIPGDTLKVTWADFDDTVKGRICKDIWALVDVIRTISRPEAPEREAGSPYRYCTADASPSYCPLLGDNNDVMPRYFDAKTLQDRIYTRYVARHGLSYRDSAQFLPEGLAKISPSPSSNKAVFTHGNIAPRNIMVDSEGHIIALLDWESSGWFPDYWEFVQMMKFCSEEEHDWQLWMDRTKPVAWDITPIQKARRVLF